MALSDKQLRFCDEYLIDLNATQAAIRAGYSEKTAASQGERLLRNVEIQQKIQELMAERSKRTEITADNVLKELAIIGFAKITDFLRVGIETLEVPKEPAIDSGETDEDGLPVIETEKRAFKVVEIFDTDKMPQTAIKAISSIKQGRSGIELRLHDKVRSLELIARHLGMLNDKLIVNADDELKALYKTVMTGGTYT